MKIPNLRQPKGSQTCGPFCVKMILKAAGIDSTLATIKKRCYQKRDGSLETGVALGLRSFGFNATLHAAVDGEVVRPAYLTKDSKFIIKSLRGRAAKSNDDESIVGYNQMAELVEVNAVKFKVPTRKEIVETIDNGYIWIAGVNATALYKENASSWDQIHHHFVIIENVDKDAFVLNDPDPDFGGVYEMDQDEFMYSLYSIDGMAISIDMVEQYVEKTV